MFACKQVSNALLEQNYQLLPPTRRAMLRLHIALCPMCGKYNRQVVDMQDGVQKFLDQEDQMEFTSEPTLCPEAMARIREGLAKLD